MFSFIIVKLLLSINCSIPCEAARVQCNSALWYVSFWLNRELSPVAREQKLCSNHSNRHTYITSLLYNLLQFLLSIHVKITQNLNMTKPFCWKQQTCFKKFIINDKTVLSFVVYDNSFPYRPVISLACY